MPLATGRGIPVHPCDPGLGKKVSQLPLHLLCADSELPKVRTTAARTVIGRSLLMIAVMAP